MQRSGQENTTLAANGTDSRAAARRMRRQCSQQPIAQLEHHYHRQHQRPKQQQHKMRDSREFVDGPPRLVASSTSALSSSRSSTSRLSSKMELQKSELGSSKTSLNHRHSTAGFPVFRGSRTAKVSAKSSVNGFSPSSSGHNGYNAHDETNDGGGVQATPYEQWRRLRRARTASGNSCASTSSTSSFASYVINPNTGRHDFGLGSDDEVDDEDLDSVMDVEEEEDGQELPSVLQHIIAPLLPPPPYPVDPYHFYCKSKRTNTGAGTAAADVTSTLATLFAGCGIEAIFHPFKCKFKCLKYVHYSHVEFVVRVYAHQRTLLVEFQRRSGSVLLWDGLYRILHQKLTLIIDASALPCSQSSGQKRIARDSTALTSESCALGSNRLDHLPADNLGAQIWRTLSLKKPTPSSGVEAMRIMLTSRHLDAMREGCAGLAELTEDVENSCLVARADLVIALIQAAAATDLNMSRCAIGALANIAQAVPRFAQAELALARRTAQQLQIQATPVVLAQLEHANKQSLFSIELLRECTRALGAFTKLALEMDVKSR